jgi:hypothetical protein
MNLVPLLRGGELGGPDDREIDIGAGDDVQIVREDVQRNVSHDLDDLGVGDTGRFRSRDRIRPDGAAIAHDLACQREDRLRMRVVGVAVAGIAIAASLRPAPLPRAECAERQ